MPSNKIKYFSVLLIIFLIQIVHCCNFTKQKIYSSKFFNRLLIFPRQDCFSHYIVPFLKSSSIVKLHEHFKKIDSSFKLEKFFPEYLLKRYSEIHNFHSPSDHTAILYHAPAQNQSILFSNKVKSVTLEESSFRHYQDLLMYVDEKVVGVSEIFEINENKKILIFYSNQKFALFLKNSHDIQALFLCSGNNCIRGNNRHFVLNTLLGSISLNIPEHLHLFIKAKYFKLNFFLKFFYWNQNLIMKYHDLTFKFDEQLMHVFSKIPYPQLSIMLATFFYIPYHILSWLTFIFPYQIYSFILFSPLYSKMKILNFLDLALLGPIVPIFVSSGIIILENTVDIYPPRIKILTAIFKIDKSSLCCAGVFSFLLILLFRILSLGIFMSLWINNVSFE